MKKNVVFDYLCLIAIYIFVLWLGSWEFAACQHISSRLFYVIFVGYSLRQYSKAMKEGRYISDIDGEFQRFKGSANLLMNNDAITFIILAWMTRDTLPIDPSIAWWVQVDGGILIAIGLLVKLSAAYALGKKGYFWYDFFSPVTSGGCQSGPYRYMKNPMYTVGYAHAYGFALVLLSGWGLLAALFDQIAILTFHYVVERPHVKALYGDKDIPK